MKEWLSIYYTSVVVPIVILIMTLYSVHVCYDVFVYQHHWCFLPLFSDTTLTVENMTRVWEKVENWDEIGRSFNIPWSKKDEISYQPSSKRERSCAAGVYWLQTSPDVSWEQLAGALYYEEEEEAVEAVKEFLPTSRGV